MIFRIIILKVILFALDTKYLSIMLHDFFETRLPYQNDITKPFLKTLPNKHGTTKAYCLGVIHYCGNNWNRIAEDTSFERKCASTPIHRSNAISILLDDKQTISLDNRLGEKRKILQKAIVKNKKKTYFALMFAFH